MVTQLLPGQCRFHVFSYPYAVSALYEAVGEIAMLDREIQRMVPSPDPF